MADKSNRNYFKDPTTNLWREPKTQDDFTTFKAKQPQAYDTYTKTYGTYTADGTRLGSGPASSSPTGTQWNNTKSSTNPINPINPINPGNGFKAPENFNPSPNARTMEDNWSTQDYIGADGGKMRVSYDNMGNYTTENFDTGDLSGYDVGSQTNYAAGNSGDAYALSRDGGATGESSGLGGIFDVKGAGGSVFSNTASGLGSLAGMYYGYKGIGAAKDALNFQKEQYADQKAQQARSNKKQEDFGLALASAMPAKNLPVNKVG